MDTLEKIERLEQRIEELGAGKEIDAKHINVLLSVQQRQLGIPPNTTSECLPIMLLDYQALMFPLLVA